MSDLNLVVSTYAGLEDILAEEIHALGGREIEVHTRAVSCIGDKGFMYKANFSLRTALKVMVKLSSFPMHTVVDLYDGVAAVDWTQFMKLEQTFAVRCILNSDLFDNNLYPALKAKDAIADQFRKNQGSRPNVEKNDPDLEVVVFISGEKCSMMPTFNALRNSLSIPVEGERVQVTIHSKTFSCALTSMSSSHFIPLHH